MDRYGHCTAWSRATSRLSLWGRSALLLRNGALLLRRRRTARLLVLLLLLLRWRQPLSALLRWSALLLGLGCALLLRGRLAHRRRGRHGGIIERYTSASESSNTIARVSSRTDMSV
jgi:hypothetical protein